MAVHDVSNLFTKRQKVAICLIFSHLMDSDGIANIIELTAAEKIGQEELNLNLGVDEEIKSLSNQMQPLSLKSLSGYLKGLNIQQKEFIMDAGFRIMKADGAITDLESDFMNEVTDELDITPAEIDATAKKFGWYPNNQTYSPVKENVNNSGCFVVLTLFIVSIISTLFIILKISNSI